MLLNITNGEVTCPFDEEDIVEAIELPLKYIDEYDTTYEVPFEQQVFLQQGLIIRRAYRKLLQAESGQRRQDGRRDSNRRGRSGRRGTSKSGLAEQR